ncbi:MAG: hypothetical protein M1834_003137 [Cirrosporium novae-zelandiae]|nr:MAG: hypothetical protein M1834_003137 [Cirrosporium novae-zelandiae]
MKSTFTTFALSAWLLAIFVTLEGVDALDMAYCSSDNTGSDNDENDYAFAILQAKGCWCSNYAPSDTVKTSKCDDACPGYPSDTCGNSDEGLYGYISLTLSPSGTQGASSSTSTTTSDTSSSSTSSTSTSSSTPEEITVVQTVTASPIGESSTDSPTTTKTATTLKTTTTHTSTSTTSTDTSTDDSTATWTPTPVISLVTVTGHVQTMTVTPTSPPTSSSTSSADSKSSGHSFWSSPGKVAGTFIGIGLVVIAIIISGFLYLRRRSQQLTGNQTVMSDDPLIRNGSKHSNFTLSSGEKLGGFGRGDSENSGEPGSSSTNRQSYLRKYDQRLEPTRVFKAENTSRISLQSFQDDQDYSRRVLTVANPDA